MKEQHHEIWHRRPEVKKRYGNISDLTHYCWIAAGLFPAPERLGPNVAAWRDSALNAFDADPEAWRREHAKAGVA